MRIRATLLLSFTLSAGCGPVTSPEFVQARSTSSEVQSDGGTPAADSGTLAPDGGGIATDAGQVPPTPPDAGPPPFAATFLIVGSNPWWVDSEVSANEPLAGVDARVDGGSWRALDLTVRDSWEGHFRIPRSSTVELRARSQSGAEVISEAFEWPLASAQSVPTEPPLPDLIISESRLASSWYLIPEYVAPDSCTVYEGCVNGTGWRVLLRFTAEIQNVGTANMEIGDPKISNDFEFSSCHGHYHFKEAADYVLRNLDRTVAADGHKQAFCFADLKRISGWSTPSSYPFSDENCNRNMGLSVGWADVYGSNLDCQFIDVTDVPSGQYLLEVSVNPGDYLQESNFENNVGEVPVVLP